MDTKGVTAPAWSFLIGLAPFVAFIALMQSVSVLIGLLAGAIVALATSLDDLAHGTGIKLMEACCFMLFVVLILGTVLMQHEWTNGGIRLAVEGGLAFIALGSVLIGFPFTEPYAREQLDESQWLDPTFHTANRWISAAWGAALAAMAGSEALRIWHPSVPQWVQVAITVLAFAGAVAFTVRYPRIFRAQDTLGLDPQA